MDLKHTHPTQVHILRACTSDDATDLLAIGGDHSVDVLVVVRLFFFSPAIAVLTTGTTILRQTLDVAVSPHSILALELQPLRGPPTQSHHPPATTGPSSMPFIYPLLHNRVAHDFRLAAAGDDFGLHLLNKKADGEESVFPFGGGLSGHHGKVNDMTFCGGWGEDSTRYVATVSGIILTVSSTSSLSHRPVPADDKMLMVWDLHPTIDIPSHNHQTGDGRSVTPSRPQPTAYVIPFSYPLTSVTAHPSTSKEFLVADCRGSVFITDWRSEEDDRSHLRHSSLVELVDPHALAASALGHPVQWSGSVAWRSDTIDM